MDEVEVLKDIVGLLLIALVFVVTIFTLAEMLKQEKPKPDGSCPPHRWRRSEGDPSRGIPPHLFCERRGCGAIAGKEEPGPET
jgi:hypothetical protein